MWQQWVKDYFTFTFKERVALIVLLSLIIIVFLLPNIIPARQWKASEKDVAAFQRIARSLQQKTSTKEADDDHFQSDYTQPSTEESFERKKLFVFDPNVISVQQWRQLGVREKTVSTIQNYLARGGKFNKAEDLRKIYGLHEDEYLRLKPFIRITDKGARPGLDERDTIHNNRHLFNSQKSRDVVSVELNTTDTSTLIQLPGIGSKLANRIIRFRDKLGGFYSVDQVAETYGLPDSTFQKIRPFLGLGNKTVVQIKINTADVSALKEHPYIGWAAARSIVAYRAQHGPFKQTDEILKVSSIPPEQLKRLIPYLSLD